MDQRSPGTSNATLRVATLAGHYQKPTLDLSSSSVYCQTFYVQPDFPHVQERTTDAIGAYRSYSMWNTMNIPVSLPIRAPCRSFPLRMN